jgi:hypothetical protein
VEQGALVPVGDGGRERGKEGEYRTVSIYICIYAKMIPVETIPGMV